MAYLLWLKDRGLEGPVKLESLRSDPTGAPSKLVEPALRDQGENQGKDQSTSRRADPIPSESTQGDSLAPDAATFCKLIFLGDSWHLGTTGFDGTRDKAENSFTEEEINLLVKMRAAMKLSDIETQYFGLVTLQSRNFQTSAVIDETDRLKLIAELRRFNPKVVLCMGRLAMKALTGSANFHGYRGKILTLPHLGPIKVLITWHPRDLLRYPPNKRQAWDDIQVAMELVRASSKTTDQ